MKTMLTHALPNRQFPGSIRPMIWVSIAAFALGMGKGLAAESTEAKPETILNLGVRPTEAAHLGLLGFTAERDCVVEGCLAVLATDRLALAFEYKQKPFGYTAAGNLVQPKDDWWTTDVAYIINPHMTVAAGYGHFGRVLNNKANESWGLSIKWEF